MSYISSLRLVRCSNVVDWLGAKPGLPTLLSYLLRRSTGSTKLIGEEWAMNSKHMDRRSHDSLQFFTIQNNVIFPDRAFFCSKHGRRDS